jgi:RNA polymerase sigma-70 factor (ECF subfamily)
VPSDFELLERWRAGDRAQGNELFRRHVRAVLRFFRNKVGGAAEDLAQRTFLAMVESRERFRGDASWRGYLFGVARNQLLMHLRRECAAKERFDPATWSVVDAGARPDRVATQHEEQALLLAALQRIPIEAQIAFELHYWEGLTIEEIAAVQGDPTGTIKARLARGRAQLKEHLATLAPDAALLASAADNLDRWAHSLPALIEPARDQS